MNVPKPLDQVRIIKSLMQNSTFDVKDKAYAISLTWLNQWKRFVGFDSVPSRRMNNYPLPPIDNGALIFNGSLRPSAKEGQDYTIITSKVWFQLKGWYGGGPEVPLEVISDPDSHKPVVISKLTRINIVYQNSHKEVKISKYKTMGDLKRLACSMLQLPYSQYCIYDYFANQKGNVYDESKTISSLFLTDGQTFLLDHLPETPLPLIATRRPSFNSSSDNLCNHSSNQLIEKEICDIDPIENSDLLSSVLQCIFHIDPLIQYFQKVIRSKKNEFRLPEKSSEKNIASRLPSNPNLPPPIPIARSNSSSNFNLPLNSGKLTGSNYNLRSSSTNLLGNVKSKVFDKKCATGIFCSLIQEYFQSTSQTISLQEFNDEISRQLNSFSAFSQTTAFETILTFLDIIHNELNSKDQGPIESAAGDGTNDFATAKIALDYFNKRNESIISDLFYGFMNSRITCPKCKTCHSVISPFASLTIKMPQPTVMLPPFTFVPYDIRKPLEAVTLEMSGLPTPSTFKERINQEFHRSFDVVFACYSNEKYSWVSNISSVPKASRCFVFEIPDAKKKYALSHIFVPGKEQNLEIGQPFLLQLPTLTPTPQQIQALAEKRLASLWLTDEPEEEEEEEEVIDDYNVVYQNSQIKQLPDKKKDPKSPTEKRKIVPTSTEASVVAAKVMSQVGTFSRKERLVAGASATIFEFRPSFDVPHPLIPVSSREVIVILNPSFMNDFSKFSWDRLVRSQISREFHPLKLKPYNLQDRLKNMQEPVKLEGQNQWLCPKCKKYVSAEQVNKVWTFPKIVVFHFGRFFQVGNIKRKSELQVEYPDEIDLGEFSGSMEGSNIPQKKPYKLIGVIAHDGSYENGKYSSFSHLHSGGWAKYVNGKALRCEQYEAHVANALILIYEEF